MIKQRKGLKLTVLVVAVLAAAGAVLAFARNRTQQNALILATEASFAPYEYYDNGKIVGVDIDIAKKIAERLGKELVVKDVAFDSIINEIKTSKSELGAAGISFTEERAEQVQFTNPYAASRQVVIVKTDNSLQNASELSGRVAVQLGSVADTYLTENYPNATLVREKKYLAAIEDLSDDKVDAVVMDELPAQKLLREDMRILDDALTTDSYGMIVQNGNTGLLNAANEVIAEMEESGEIDAIILGHMGVDSDQPKYDNLLMNAIYQNLIRDQRYQYILRGLANTLIMAFGAVILGFILGVVMGVVRCYHDNTHRLKILNLLSKMFITIIRGTPSILQLMIIYYVIFAQTDINIVIVGILAFGLNSSAYIAEIMRAGIQSVDVGQLEAAYSLGLNYRRALSYIILPQALRNILPALGNEFITLVKETAVGAYIGIVELTKASDIIASRTYDYFFPLIVVALIYLLITYTLTKLVAMMERRLNAARR